VKWSPKEKARRLVVITTEAEFHIAGDGLVCIFYIYHNLNLFSHTPLGTAAALSQFSTSTVS
jgi:hypothetical protein